MENMVNKEKYIFKEPCESEGNDCEVNTFYSSPCFAAEVNKEYMGLATEDEILKSPFASTASIWNE